MPGKSIFIASSYEAKELAKRIAEERRQLEARAKRLAPANGATSVPG